MMFHVVALAYVLIAGQPVDEPLVFVHHSSFVGLDKCQAFLQSNEFEASRVILSQMVAHHLPRQKTADGDEDDDGAAVPAVAVTASCEEDNEL